MVVRKLFHWGQKTINSILEEGGWEHYDELHDIIKEAIENNKYSVRGFVELLQRSHLETNAKLKNDRIRAIEEIIVKTGNAAAVESLLGVFANVLDSSIRNALVRIACQAGDIRLERPLIGMLRSEDKELRHAAALILRKVGGPGSFDSLRAACLETTGWTSRHEAMEVLDGLDRGRAVDALFHIIRIAPKADVRSAIVKLAQIMNPAAQRALIETSKNESSRIRLWTAQAMAAIKNEAFGPALEELTHDDHDAVVLAGLEGLLNLEDKSYTPRILALTNHKDKEIATRAIQVLKTLGDDTVVEPLIAKLRGKDLMQRQAAIETLSVLGQSRSVDTCRMLINIMVDPDINVRRCAVEVISAVGAKGVIHELFQYLKDEDWWVREQVAATFCELGDTTIIEPVIALLDDAAHRIRRYAVEILNAMPDARAVPSLLRILEQDEDWWIRERAIETLGLIKDHSTVHRLIDLLDDQELRWVTVRALSNIGNPAAFLPLIEILGDDREEIRIEILEALNNLGMVREAKDEITKLLSDPSKIIRMRSRELLGGLLEDIEQKVKEGETEWQKKYLSELDHYLLKVKSSGAADLFIAANRVPLMKKHGDVLPLSDKVMIPDQTKEMLLEICPIEIREKFMQVRDADFSYSIPGEGRYRVNIFLQRAGISAVFRVTPDKPPTIKQLGMPEIVYFFTRLNQGLVLVTGSIGSGKSTTLAAIINEINETRHDHILTIEDPIEYIHQHKNCVVNQRELGGDTLSFAAALRSALREDPDVILVGELRDLETVSMAVTAAETGHLVFGTLHTNSAAKTIDRIIDVYPASQVGQIRTMLSESLEGVVSQQLVKKKSGGITAAMEILLGTPALAKLIREGKTFQIPTIMITGRKQGMQTMDQALMELYRQDIITIEEAHSKAVSKKEFEDFLIEEQKKKSSAPADGQTAGPGQTETSSTAAKGK